MSPDRRLTRSAILSPTTMSEIVGAGYDNIAERYAAHRDQFESLPYLERFAALLPSGGRVLDIGCGAGMPAAQFLAGSGFQVHGIDISQRMVELARRNVPEGVFEVRDMQSLRAGEGAYDGIVALYSVFHVPRHAHAGLLGVFRGLLGANGVLLLTMGAEAWEGTEADFHGTEMYWSHFGRAANRAMLEAAGFVALLDEIDASGGERHQVLLGRAARAISARGIA